MTSSRGLGTMGPNEKMEVEVYGIERYRCD